MPRKCGSVTNAEETRERRIQFQGEVRSGIRSVDDEKIIYIAIHYTVLYRNSGENLPLASIQAQHQVLNACFNALNDNISKVSSSGRYNFKSVVGNSKLVFLPTHYADLTEEHVTRVSVNTNFAGLTSVQDHLQSSGISLDATRMNMMIAPLEDILGEARMESNVCVVTTGSVGGELALGSMSEYGLGRTAVHEVGHCLGLPHIFTGTCTQVFSDIPAQRIPNFSFNLTSGGRLCNRDRDCKYHRNGDTSVLQSGVSLPYSCFSCHTAPPTCDECDTELYEQALNFLDYVDDSEMVMFSAQQSLHMRQVLRSESTGITLYDGEDDPNIPVTAGVDTGSGSVGRKTNISLIVTLSVFTGLVVVFMALFFVMYMH